MLLETLFFLAKYLEAFDKVNPAPISSISSLLSSNLLYSWDFSIRFIPLIIIVISPMTSFPSKNSITWLMVLPICSSNFFVSSRETCISLSPPKYFFNSINSFLRRCGASNKIVVLSFLLISIRIFYLPLEIQN